jgi:hypothetical protein
VQPRLPAQLGAQPAQRMAARHLVAAIRADDEQRLRLERRREHGEHVERRVVGPLQVVEEDRGRALGRDGGEGRDHLVAQRRAVQARHADEVGQRGGQRPIGRRAALQPGPLEHREARLVEHVAREDGLADPGLACEQHQRAAAGARPVDRGLQLRTLVVATDQHVSS